MIVIVGEEKTDIKIELTEKVSAVDIKFRLYITYDGQSLLCWKYKIGKMLLPRAGTKTILNTGLIIFTSLKYFSQFILF